MDEVLAPGSCPDKNCPRVFAGPDADTVEVQGYLPDGSETRVSMPAAELELLARQYLTHRGRA